MLFTRQMESYILYLNICMPELREVVMGLHWDPPQHLTGGQPTELAVLCVILKLNDWVLEAVHPGNPSSIESSVIHTGDSRTGGSL